MENGVSARLRAPPKMFRSLSDRAQKLTFFCYMVFQYFGNLTTLQLQICNHFRHWKGSEGSPNSTIFLAWGSLRVNGAASADMFPRLHHWLDRVTGKFTRSATLLGSVAEVLEPEGTSSNKCKVGSVTRLWGLLGQEDPCWERAEPRSHSQERRKFAE